MVDAAIEVHELCKTYVDGLLSRRRFAALKNVTFNVQRGEIFRTSWTQRSGQDHVHQGAAGRSAQHEWDGHDAGPTRRRARRPSSDWISARKPPYPPPPQCTERFEPLRAAQWYDTRPGASSPRRLVEERGVGRPCQRLGEKVLQGHAATARAGASRCCTIRTCCFWTSRPMGWIRLAGTTSAMS